MVTICDGGSQIDSFYWCEVAVLVHDDDEYEIEFEKFESNNNNNNATLTLDFLVVSYNLEITVFVQNVIL